MHLMIDFETLATTPDCAVLSLGAVLECRNLGIKEEREWFFCTDSQGNRTTDPLTKAWWSRQGPEAQTIFERCKTSGTPLTHFVGDFSDWLRGRKPLFVWGNGALFDVAIAENIMRQHGQKSPWNYGNVMCYRTIKNLFHIDKGIPFEGVKHNALDDARHQMKCLMTWLDSKAGWPDAV